MDASGGQTTSYAYDAASNLTQMTLPSGNGYVETRAYDRAGRLTEVSSQKGATVLARFLSTLDPVGNPTQIVRSGSLAQTQTYAYDTADRLTSVCFQAGTCPGASDPFIRWAYDRVGNRLSEQRPGQTTSYSYDARDRLLAAGSTSYTYDQNGNELSAGSRAFSYDLANRLQTTTALGTTTTYVYDGEGVRLQASTGAQANRKTNFLWDVNGGLPQIAQERDGGGSLLRRYVYGVSRISMTAGNSTSYYLRDGLHSSANLTSSSGATQWTWSYEPFGSVRSETKASGNQPENPMRFIGEYLDPTGLYHLRARQYDPVSGRFLSQDPVSSPVGLSYIATYGYARNRPTVMVDPSGLSPLISSRIGTESALSATTAAAEPGFTINGCAYRALAPQVDLQYGLVAPNRYGRGRGRVDCSKSSRMRFFVCTQIVFSVWVDAERCALWDARIDGDRSIVRRGPKLKTRAPCPFKVFTSRIRDEARTRSHTSAALFCSSER